VFALSSLRGGRQTRAAVIVAAFVTLVDFAIPHSIWGAQAKWDALPKKPGPRTVGRRARYPRSANPIAAAIFETVGATSNDVICAPIRASVRCAPNHNGVGRIRKGAHITDFCG
jgi:hypothetical protein